MNSEIRVPEGMLDAADNCYGVDDDRPWNAYKTSDILEAALRWLSEHPIVPTDEQAREMFSAIEGTVTLSRDQLRTVAVEWQRRMFRAEEDVPEAIKDRMWVHYEAESIRRSQDVSQHNAQILEVYLLGQKSRETK